MAFPSKAELKKVAKKLEKAEGTLMPPQHPTPLEAFRYQLQQKFVAYVLEKKITQKELASILRIDEAKVSKILRNRIDEFSTDRLIMLYEKLNPKVKLKVS